LVRVWRFWPEAFALAVWPLPLAFGGSPIGGTAFGGRSDGLVAIGGGACGYYAFGAAPSVCMPSPGCTGIRLPLILPAVLSVAHKECFGE